MDYSLLVGIHNIDQAVAGSGGEWCSNSSPPVSWHPDEGGRRPAMLERIGTNIQQNYFLNHLFNCQVQLWGFTLFYYGLRQRKEKLFPKILCCCVKKAKKFDVN
jgi:hypothetical protein